MQNLAILPHFREVLTKSNREFSFPVWCIIQLDQPTAGQFLASSGTVETHCKAQQSLWNYPGVGTLKYLATGEDISSRKQLLLTSKVLDEGGWMR
jgi:hypothetical protein